MSPTDYGECDITNADGCVYEQFSYENAKYCCNYVLDTETSDSQISQQQLFTQVTLVRNLNIASLSMDYFFVFLAGCVLCAFWSRKGLEAAKPYTIAITSIGSIIDIILTFTIVGIINDNNLIDAFSDLYHKKCYSENIELTIIDFQDQFESILVLDVLEGSLDILSLIILSIGWFRCRNNTIEHMAIGIHGFIFTAFDLAIISVNVFIFVIPTYDAFISAYDDQDYLCFKELDDSIFVSDTDGDPDWYTGFATTEMDHISSTQVTRNVTKVADTQWYEGLSQSERVWMGVGFSIGGLLVVFVCIPAFCFLLCSGMICRCCDDCVENQKYSKVQT